MASFREKVKKLIFRGRKMVVELLGRGCWAVGLLDNWDVFELPPLLIYCY